jgi:hypothetical protein
VARLNARARVSANSPPLRGTLAALLRRPWADRAAGWRCLSGAKQAPHLVRKVTIREVKARAAELGGKAILVLRPREIVTVRCRRRRRVGAVQSAVGCPPPAPETEPDPGAVNHAGARAYARRAQNSRAPEPAMLSGCPLRSVPRSLVLPAQSRPHPDRSRARTAGAGDPTVQVTPATISAPRATPPPHRAPARPAR